MRLQFLSCLLLAAILLITPVHANNDAVDLSGYLALGDEYDVTILRDTWGVPHIFGKTNADASFGLAYAHAEDDMATIIEALLQSRGQLGAVQGMNGAITDFIVHLFKVWEHIDEKYESDLSPATRKVCEAYADGLNLYSAKHPEEGYTNLMPFTGKDVVAGFVFKSPFFYGLDGVVSELTAKERRREVSTKTASLEHITLAEALEFAGNNIRRDTHIGSNTFSVGPSRSADGWTRLNVNAHQPYTGMVAWYEAHMVSEEGMDIVGALFPGSPVILHGHNRDLGWAHTVNSPDLADIYVLEINPDNPDQYKFDGEWLDFEKAEATLQVLLSPQAKQPMPVKRELLWSVHGPAMRTPHGVYAIRYTSMGDIRAVEQYYREGIATNMDEWMDAVKMRAVPSLNFGYADKEGNIGYLYNATMPKRVEGYDWEQYLPGDTSETLWTEYVPFEGIPQVFNPASGFVQNCNNTPFNTTTGPEDPDANDFSKTFGIETHMTNRGLRAMELFGADESITREEFLKYKFDMYYAEDSTIGKSVKIILAAPESDDPVVREAVELIRGWDLQCNPESKAAAVAVLTLQPLIRGFTGSPPPIDDVMEKLKEVANKLKEDHGTVGVEWSTINRLRRGDLDIGIGGGPDILHAVYGGQQDDLTYTARAGDTYVLIAEWDKEGNVHSSSVHQFGSATLDESSPHYADQAPLMARRELKPVWMDEKDIRANLQAEYKPGEEGK
jgi:penicillin amidase/acyl-homoserine-lactone acylase